MAKTESNMLALGTKAPAFTLYDSQSEQTISLMDLSIDKGLVVLFICNHCPYVIHLNKALVALANDYQSKGICFIAISSNDASNYPQDGPVEMTKHAKQNHYPFPYLYDETQSVAKAYRAACTPDIYLFDEALTLKYRGQFDASRPGNDVPVTGNELRFALACLLDGAPLPERQKASLGCNIKWKANA